MCGQDSTKAFPLSLLQHKIRHMESEQATRRSVYWIATVALIAVCGLALNPVKHAGDAYPHNYHGSLTSWFALMSENMEQNGFVSSRFLAPINPNPAGVNDQRLYITHPSLDVVVRAGLIRLLGNAEWVNRLQGLVGCFGAALLLFISLQGRLSRPSRIVAALAMAGMPIFQRLTSLSMHHPMTLLFSTAALCAYLRGQEKRSTRSIALMFCLLLLAMHNDWPGYFMVAVIWTIEVTRLKNADRRLIVGLPLLTAASIALLLIHVNVIGGQDFFTALRASAQSPLPPLTGGTALSLSWSHQVDAFGWIGISMMLAAMVLCVGIKRLQNLRPLVFGLVLLGAFNFILFPMKAPREDFWGCYWLPLSGLSAGVVSEAVMMRLRFPPLLLVVLSATLAVSSAVSLDWDERAQKSGTVHKEQSLVLLDLIPAADRGLFITNVPNRELKIAMAYTRTSMLFDDVEPASIKTLPERVNALFHELPRGRILFICDPAQPAVIRLVNQYGTTYRDIPFIIDVTAFISSS